MAFGYFPAARFPLIGVGMIAAGLIICQLLANFYGHEDLFPFSSIYNCAKHAPQYVFFRISTICGATLFLLTWIINFAFINQVCPKANVISGIVTFLGILSTLAQMLAAATIDTGVENFVWVLQTKNAYAMFTGITLTLNTLLYMLVHKINKGVKRTGNTIKILLNAIIILIGYVAYENPSGQSPLRFILQYGFVFTTLAYYWSLSKSYKKYIIDYELTA